MAYQMKRIKTKDVEGSNLAIVIEDNLDQGITFDLDLTKITGLGIQEESFNMGEKSIYNLFYRDNFDISDKTDNRAINFSMLQDRWYDYINESAQSDLNMNNNIIKNIPTPTDYDFDSKRFYASNLQSVKFPRSSTVTGSEYYFIDDTTNIPNDTDIERTSSSIYRKATGLGTGWYKNPNIVLGYVNEADTKGYGQGSIWGLKPWRMISTQQPDEGSWETKFAASMDSVLFPHYEYIRWNELGYNKRTDGAKMGIVFPNFEDSSTQYGGLGLIRGLAKISLDYSTSSDASPTGYIKNNFEKIASVGLKIVTGLLKSDKGEDSIELKGAGEIVSLGSKVDLGPKEIWDDDLYRYENYIRGLFSEDGSISVSLHGTEPGGECVGLKLDPEQIYIDELSIHRDEDLDLIWAADPASGKSINIYTDIMSLRTITPVFSSNTIIFDIIPGTGGTVSLDVMGGISLNNLGKISNSTEPINPSDLATKNYVDSVLDTLRSEIMSLKS